MLEQEDASKFDFKEKQRTMILSVLSSFALVSGLMVVRAKNPVHSVLFFILVFCNTSGLLILLGLDFFAMIFLVVYIGAIAVFHPSLALFTSEWYYWTDLLVGNVLHFR